MPRKPLLVRVAIEISIGLKLQESNRHQNRKNS